jgi:hypothetical protein
MTEVKARSNARQERTYTWPWSKTLLAAIIAVAASLAAPTETAAQTDCGFIPIGGPPGLAYPLFDWRLLANGRLPQSYGYALTEDTIQIDVADGTDLRLAMNEMLITLVINVHRHWKKGVFQWNSRAGQGSAILAPENGGLIIPPDGLWRVSMKITKPSCTNVVDTIVLVKAKAFGALWPVYHLDPNNFWALWGGKSVTFTWVADSGVSTPYSSMIGCNAPACLPLGTSVRGIVADRVIWRPATGDWWFDAAGGPVVKQQWGSPGDIPVRGDYDGDRLMDIAFWRPSSGEWRIINSSDGSGTSPQLGEVGDVPVPADYDGDGRTDLAVWRPSTREWRIINSSIGVTVQKLDDPGEIAVPGDYDGDRRTDIAVWGPSTGMWRVLHSNFGNQTKRQWGLPGDIPVPADYDRDGRTDFAIWRPSTGEWWIINSSKGDVDIVTWGLKDDIPVPGDFDHDGHVDFAVWRPSLGQWFVILSSTGNTRDHQWGENGDVPIRPGPKFR